MRGHLWRSSLSLIVSDFPLKEGGIGTDWPKKSHPENSLEKGRQDSSLNKSLPYMKSLCIASLENDKNSSKPK